MEERELTYRGNDGCELHAVAVSSGEPCGPAAPVLVLMYGGGPDHHSLMPLARRLADRIAVVLPDVRGYGRSVCIDPARHTWTQYADDVVSLLDCLDTQRAIVGGAGLGATITLRAAIAYPERVRGAVLLSVEDIEDDQAKAAEIAFMDAFAARVRADGIQAAWHPILKDLAPVIGSMVRDAIPRSNPASIAAAAAIGRDRSFRSVEELKQVDAPTLVVPGMDARHPAALAERLAGILPNGRLASISLPPGIRSADDFAKAFAPAIREFLALIVHETNYGSPS